MTTAADLKRIVALATPLIEQALDVADEMAAVRQMAADKEIDWLPLRSLLKAQIQDARDGGDRVEKLMTRADHSASYASLLGVVEVRKHFEPAATEKPADAKTSGAAVTQAKDNSANAAPVSAPAFDNGGIPPGFERTAKVSA